MTDIIDEYTVSSTGNRVYFKDLFGVINSIKYNRVQDLVKYFKDNGIVIHKDKNGSFLINRQLKNINVVDEFTLNTYPIDVELHSKHPEIQSVHQTVVQSKCDNPVNYNKLKLFQLFQMIDAGY